MLVQVRYIIVQFVNVFFLAVPYATIKDDNEYDNDSIECDPAGDAYDEGNGDSNTISRRHQVEPERFQLPHVVSFCQAVLNTVPSKFQLVLFFVFVLNILDYVISYIHHLYMYASFCILVPTLLYPCLQVLSFETFLLLMFWTFFCGFYVLHFILYSKCSTVQYCGTNVISCHIHSIKHTKHSVSLTCFGNL